MNVFKFLNSFRLQNTAEDAEQGGLPSPTLNPRNAAMAEIAKSAHEQVAGDLNAFDEDTGQITPNNPEPPKEEKKEETPADPPAISTVAQDPPAPRMATIVVDGQAIEVEESRLIEAGKRTLQKETAADRRLQEAENKRRQAESLLEQAQRVSNNGQPPSVPSQDAPRQAQQATNGFDPAMLDTVLDQKLYIRDAQKAREAFEKEFPEIASDPDLMQVAAAREQRRLDTAAALGESLGNPFEAYRAHGEAIRSLLKKHAAPAASPETLDKAERKRSITAVSAVNAKTPAPQEKKPLSVSEVIEQQRLARRQGRQLPTH